MLLTNDDATVNIKRILCDLWFTFYKKHTLLYKLFSVLYTLYDAGVALAAADAECDQAGVLIAAL